MADLDSISSSGESPTQWPWIFALLIAPMGVLTNGLFGGALAYLMGRQGVDPARQSTVIALLILPQTIYFVWSPLTDFWLARRRWLFLGALGAAFAVALALRSVQLDAPATIAVLFVGGCLGQLVTASCGGLMGTLQGETVRQRAGGFYQAGSLGFGALAVFGLTLLAQWLSLPALGLCMAAMIGLPGLASFWAADSGLVHAGSLLPTLRRVGSEFRATFLRWSSIPYVAVMVLPMGSGSLVGLLPGLAADYHVDGQYVAWINGLAGSLLCCGGSLIAGSIAHRFHSVRYYALVVATNLLPLAVLWSGPLTPRTYLIGSSLMLLSIGACYGALTGVILDFIGPSGKSGSSRYSLTNSLANLPVAYMAYLDGRGYALGGPHGMPGMDLILSTVGLTVLLLIAPRRTAADSLIKPVVPATTAA
jgi:hypothetical protein